MFNAAETYFIRHISQTSFLNKFVNFDGDGRTSMELNLLQFNYKRRFDHVMSFRGSQDPQQNVRWKAL